MKKIILALLLIPTFTIAQKKDSTNLKGVYGMIYLQLETSGGNPGGGLTVGYNFINPMGIGIGVESIPMKTLAGKNGGGINAYGELRFTAPSKKVAPSVAFQYGRYQYSDRLQSSSGTTISQSAIDGRQSLGFNVAIVFNGKKPGCGFFIGYTLKRIDFDIKAVVTEHSYQGGQSYSNTSTVANSITTSFNLVSIGFKF